MYSTVHTYVELDRHIPRLWQCFKIDVTLLFYIVSA